MSLELDSSDQMALIETIPEWRTNSPLVFLFLSPTLSFLPHIWFVFRTRNPRMCRSQWFVIVRRLRKKKMRAECKMKQRHTFDNYDEARKSFLSLFLIKSGAMTESRWDFITFFFFNSTILVNIDGLSCRFKFVQRLINSSIEFVFLHCYRFNGGEFVEQWQRQIYANVSNVNWTFSDISTSTIRSTSSDSDVSQLSTVRNDSKLISRLVLSWIERVFPHSDQRTRRALTNVSLMSTVDSNNLIKTEQDWLDFMSKVRRMKIVFILISTSFSLDRNVNKTDGNLCQEFRF